MKLLTILLFVCGFCTAQVTINGTIKDVLTNQPVEMVTVNASGTNTITMSNAEGKFRISVPQSANQLYISHLSYKNYQIAINMAPEDIEVFLEPASVELDEVVVSSKPVYDLLKDAVNASKKSWKKH